MNYYVTMDGKPLSDGIRRFHGRADDAWTWIERQEHLWRIQGYRVPHYQVWYGSQEQTRLEIIKVAWS